jgi:hypothetical protein
MKDVLAVAVVYVDFSESRHRFLEKLFADHPLLVDTLGLLTVRLVSKSMYDGH